ncbi:MAG: PAS domain-containing protein [Desulfobacteraceae bacterium]|nr:MAG: PAS domain-containing protein [Desulfobacteraceae bacterium]
MKSKALITLSLIIVISHVLFVLLNYMKALEDFNKELEDWAVTIEDNFIICLDSRATAMQKLATFIANDPKVQQQFKKGKLAVESEGGGKGGEKSSAARQKLFDLVHPSWDQVTENYDVRQLHFHLGPGSRSFLRVHKPTAFGDNLGDIRYMVIAANQNNRSYKGFETGRHYTGIRGVVPVSFKDSQGRVEHLGAVEAGTSYKIFLNAMKKKMAADFCLLLTKSHVDRTMTPASIKAHFSPGAILKDYYIEETTDPRISQYLESGDFYDRVMKKGAAFIKGPPHFQVTAFPVRDFRSTMNPSLPDSGSILVWKDASGRWQSFMGNFYRNIIFAVLALLTIGCILITVWNYSRKKLKRVIETQAEEIKDNYEKFNLFVKASPTAILIVDDATNKILDINPRALRLMGGIKDDIINRLGIDDIVIKEDNATQELDSFRFVTSSGQAVPVLKTEVPLRLDQKNVTVVSLRDVTKEKKAEMEKIKIEKLQGVIEMAGAVSHELNQPMQVIYLASDLLSQKMLDHSAKERLAEELLNALERMKSITGKLMNITTYKTKDYLSGKIIDIDGAIEKKEKK